VLKHEKAIAFDENSSHHKWTAHTNGTLALMRLRGEELLQTDFGKEIYIQVANNIRASCSQRIVPLPAGFEKFDKQMLPLLGNRRQFTSWWPLVDSTIRLGTMLERKSQRED
jgi:hypothetical protein